jgi:hypothetical protein
VTIPGPHVLFLHHRSSRALCFSSSTRFSRRTPRWRPTAWPAVARSNRSSCAGWPPSGVSPRWPAAWPTRAPWWTRTAAAAGEGQLGGGRSRGDERGAGPDRERGDLVAGDAATLHLGGGARSRSAPAGAPLPGRPPRRRRVREHHPVSVTTDGLLQSHRRRSRRRVLPELAVWEHYCCFLPWCYIRIFLNVAMVIP